MGKTDFCKKSGEIKGRFHGRMGMVKNSNSKDLTDAEEIKQRWQEYAEELYKECCKYWTIALISHVSNVMFKILWARLQQYVNWDLPDVQVGLSKGRGTRDQIANIYLLIEEARNFQESIYFCLTDYTKAFDCVDHNKLWKSLKEMGITDHLICLLRNLYEGQEATVRTECGTTVFSKLGKEYIKTVYCHPAYLTSHGMLGWMNHKLESRFLGEISTTLDMQDLVLGLGRYPLKRTGYLLQYSCQENSKDRRTWLQSMGSQRVRNDWATFTQISR